MARSSSGGRLGSNACRPSRASNVRRSSTPKARRTRSNGSTSSRAHGRRSSRSTGSVRQRIRLLRVHGLRAADAFQLGAAISAAEDQPASLTLVTLDERLARAAQRGGIQGRGAIHRVCLTLAGSWTTTSACPTVFDVKALPDGLETAALIVSLADGWGFDVVTIDYAPVGFGSYHWVATDVTGARVFVTVDELDRKPWLGDTRESAFDGLTRAFSSATSLRDAGLDFVVAPIHSKQGDPNSSTWTRSQHRALSIRGRPSRWAFRLRLGGGA